MERGSIIDAQIEFENWQRIFHVMILLTPYKEEIITNDRYKLAKEFIDIRNVQPKLDKHFIK